jgi:hypothetical protein
MIRCVANMRRMTRTLLGFALVGCLFAASAARAEDPEITKRRLAERKSFSDAEIANGFFRTVFGAELGLDGRTNRVRKFEKPVRVFIEQSSARPDRRAQVAAVLADIGAHIPNIDIAVVNRRDKANYVVHLVRDRDLNRTIGKMFGGNGRRIVKSLEPQCLSGFSKDEHYRIIKSDVILVVDAGDFIFYDCAYEEMLQALGPVRDDDFVPWTMFNDDVQMGFFDIYDQFILNILYDKRVRAGMSTKDMIGLLPEILPDVRAQIARKNGLPTP